MNPTEEQEDSIQLGFYECVYWQIFYVTEKIYKFLKQICENMATNLEPRDKSDSLGRQSRKNRGSIRDDFVYESPMTKPVMNEVNIISKGRSVIVDVDDNRSMNKHGGARPKQNQEICLVTVIQKLDTVLFELANLKTQLAQKADMADLDAL